MTAVGNREARRQARLELDAPLRPGLDPAAAQALAQLLAGQAPDPRPAHPLFARPEAASILVGESLDHATRGSALLRDADGRPRLLVSASLPPLDGLLAEALDWLGQMIAPEAGDIAGFVVPPGTHRHDMRLLVWDGTRLVRLGPDPVDPHAVALEERPSCSPTAFLDAAGLPPPDAAEAVLRPAARRVALALAEGRALPVSQARLDGPLRHGQGSFRSWLAAAAGTLHGFTTRPPPALIDATA